MPPTIKGAALPKNPSAKPKNEEGQVGAATDKPSQKKSRGSRTHTRRLLIQALYASAHNKEDLPSLVRYCSEQEDYAAADKVLFTQWLHLILKLEATLVEQLSPCINRSWASVSPIEKSILLLGAFELLHQKSNHRSVIINEALNLAHAFGATDGYRFINSALDKLASEVRAEEVRIVNDKPAKPVAKTVGGERNKTEQKKGHAP